MEKPKTRKKFLSLHTQLRLLAAIAAVIVVTALILVVINSKNSGEAGVKGVYDAGAAIEAASARLGTGKAAIMKESDDRSFKVKLIFEGGVSPVLSERIIELLEKYGMSAVFCASTIDAVENVDALQFILSKGYRLGSYCMRGEAHMETLTQDELLKSLCTSESFIDQATGMQPRLLRCYRSEYNDTLLDTAYAAGYEEVIEAQCEVGLQSFSSFSSVQRYVNRQKPGTIIAFRMTPADEEPKATSKPAPGENNGVKPAVDMQESVTQIKPAAGKQESVARDADWVDLSLSSDAERALLIAEWLIRANAEADYSTQAEELRIANAGKTAPLQRELYTTKRGVSLLFGRIGENNEELQSLLSTLKELNATGTFAVTLGEAKTNRDAIRAVIAAGHSVETAVRPKDESDYYQLSSQLLLCRQLLRERYGVNPGKFCVTLGHVDSPAMAEAASAVGCEQIGYHSAVSQAAGDTALSANELLGKVFSNRSACLQRGHIFYFPLNNYENANTVSELVRAIYTERNVYPACALRDIVDDASLRYTYPVDSSAYLPGIDDIKSGHIRDESLLMDIIASHYLGCSNASSEENLPGFDDDERGRLNKKGFITTRERVAFLTFDDWGTDANIDPLLSVLKEHNAKAVFFIRSNHVAANPNLARAIAADGHEIGSHTHEHLPLSDAIGDTMVYESLTGEEVARLANDLSTSWYTLASIASDMETNGHPSLIKVFRPPTLAVSKVGLRTVFDMGFEYVASGSYSSHDYEAESAEALYSELRAHLKPGAVFVMHMSADAKHTPAALELLFSYNEKQPASKQYRFELMGDYLDGTAEVEHPY